MINLAFLAQTGQIEKVSKSPYGRHITEIMTLLFETKQQIDPRQVFTLHLAARHHIKYGNFQFEENQLLAEVNMPAAFARFGEHMLEVDVYLKCHWVFHQEIPVIVGT